MKNRRRHDMSEICHPYKITADKFTEEMRDSLDPFLANMKHLKFNEESKYIEEWFEIFARWTEIQSEGFDPFLPEEK